MVRSAPARAIQQSPTTSTPPRGLNCLSKQARQNHHKKTTVQSLATCAIAPGAPDRRREGTGVLTVRKPDRPGARDGKNRSGTAKLPPCRHSRQATSRHKRYDGV